MRRIVDPSGPALAPYVEGIAGLLVLGGLNVAFLRSHWGYLDVQPHPFWLVVLLIAARYGSPAGFITGLLAAGTYLAFQVVGPAGASAEPLMKLSVQLQAFLLVLGGSIVGEIRQGVNNRYAALLRQHQEVSQALRDLAVKYLTVNEVQTELEKRIVGQTATVATLYEAAKHLQSLQLSDLYIAIVELVIRFLHAEGCALYLLRDGALRLQAASPSESPWERKMELVPQEGIIARSLAEKEMKSVREALGLDLAAAYAEQPVILCGALLDASGEPLGVLIVERMPFLELTASAEQMFAMIVDWASGALQAAMTYEQTKDRNIEDDVTGAYTFAYVQKRTEEERLRAVRYGLALSLLFLEIEDYLDITSTLLPKVLTVLGMVFRNNLRSIDIVGHGRQPGGFVMLLPITPPDGANVVLGRIETEVEAFGFRPFADNRELRVHGGVVTLDPQQKVWRTPSAGPEHDGFLPSTSLPSELDWLQN